MQAWFLLALTILAAFITFESFRWHRAMKRAPFGAIASLWKGGLSHLSVAEQNNVKERYLSGTMGIGQFPWLFLAITIGLAIFTVRAFYE